jgi:hypothetical protein
MTDSSNPRYICRPVFERGRRRGLILCGLRYARKIHVAIWAVCWFGAGFPAFRTLRGAGFEYKVQTQTVLDVAKVVDRDQFSEAKVLELFRRFGDAECSNRALVRLIVAPSQEDLAAVTNVRLPELRAASIPRLLADAHLLGEGLDSVSAAEFLCYRGAGTAYVRSERRLRKFPVFGDHNAFDWSDRDLGIKLVGFNLWDFQAETGTPDRLWVFARASSLPDLARATAFRDELRRRLGIRVELVMRTDSSFFNYGGPSGDAFEEGSIKISPMQFLIAPHVVCGPTQCQMEVTPGTARVSQ